MTFGHVVISSNMVKFDSQVIKYVTNSYFSHSFITAPPMCDRLMCLEASAGGVMAMPFDVGYENDEDQDFIMFELNVPIDVKTKAVSLIMNDLEKKYGYPELPWFAWRRICEFFGKDIKHKDNWSKRGIICSELVVNYLTYCGLGHLFNEFGDGSVNAEDVYRVCLAHPELFTEVKRKIRNPNDKRLAA